MNKLFKRWLFEQTERDDDVGRFALLMKENYCKAPNGGIKNWQKFLKENEVADIVLEALDSAFVDWNKYRTASK